MSGDITTVEVGRGSQPVSQPESSGAPGDLSEVHGVPEKFLGQDGTLTPEGVQKLAESYTQLERSRLGQPPQPAPTGQPVVPQPQAQPSPKPEDPERQADARETYRPFYEEFARTGGLSEASYTALQEMGHPKEIVDSYMHGQMAMANQQAQGIYDAFGGVEAFQRVSQWAAQNLPAHERQALNQSFLSGNAGVTQAAVAGLKARYEHSMGSGAPTLERGGAGESIQSGPAPYGSQGEWERDLADDRYETDEAFRKQVEQRLAKSDHLFGDGQISVGRMG